MGCATGIVKYLVFLANLVFALAGLALVIIGVMYKYNYSEATNLLPTDFGVAPILSIIIGAIVFITAFLGCCGAVKESSCMLTTYAIILLTIFILQVAIGVYTFMQINDSAQFHDAVRGNLKKIFNSYQTDDAKRESVDGLQTLFNCCGVDDQSEMTLNNGSLPLSCCHKGVPSCRSADYNVHTQGCARAIYEFLENCSQMVGGVAIGIALIELKCCGLDGPDSFPGDSLPRSCCKPDVDICRRTFPNNLYHEGCDQKIMKFIQQSPKVIGGVIIGIAIIEIICVIAALYLANTIRHRFRRNLYA